MKTKKRNILKEYENIKTELVNEFLIKHEYDLEYTDIEIIGHIVILNDDIYISLDDIEYDLEKNVSKNSFFDWYYYDLYNIIDGYPHINYQSYIRGFRHKRRGLIKEAIYKFKNYVKTRIEIVRILFNNTFRSNKKFKEEFNKFMEQHNNNPLDRCI